MFVDLYPDDYLPYKCLSTDGTFIYALKSGVTSPILYKLDSAYTETQLADFSTYQNQTASSVITMVLHSVGVLFVQINDSTNHRYLFKSVDGGVSFGNNAPLYNNGNWVERIGFGPGISGNTHVDNVSILGERGWLRASDGTLYYGEYNVNASRTNGGANDRVAVRKSTDNGDTWTTLVEWNTNGTHYTRHCHYVGQDPKTGLIYVGFGDSGTEMGLIEWDGAGVWQNNIALSDYDAITGFHSLSGKQQYSVTDLIFHGDTIYNPVDNSPGSDPDGYGIWCFKTGLKNYAPVSRRNKLRSQSSMYWGLLTSNNTLVVCELTEGAAAEKSFNVYTSTDGKTWCDTGSFYLIASATGGLGPQGLFEFKGKIFIAPSGTPAGKDPLGTGIFTEQVVSECPSPKTLYPVYWVTPSGDTTATGGYRPSPGWQSVNHALTGNRITFQGRIIVSGQTSETGTLPSFAGHVRPSNDLSGVRIEGVSGAKLLGTSGSYTLYAAEASHIGEIEGLSLEHQTSTSSVITNEATMTKTTKLKSCVIGSDLVQVSRGINTVSGVWEIENCDIKGAAIAGTVGIYCNTPAVGSTNTVKVTNTIIKGFEDCVVIADADGQVYNSVLDSPSRYGVFILGVASTAPRIKNTITRNTGTRSLDDISSLVYNGEVDYNLLDQASAGLGGTHSQNNIADGTDPQFVDPANGDYTLKATSPCLGAGTATWSSSEGRHISRGGEPRPDLGVDIGPFQQDGKLHPRNL